MKKILMIVVMIIVASTMYGFDISVEKNESHEQEYYSIETTDPVTSLSIDVTIEAFGREVVLEGVRIRREFIEGENRFYIYQTTADRFITQKGELLFEEIDEVISFTVTHAAFFSHNYLE